MFDKLLPTLREIDTDSNDFEQWARLKVGVRLPMDVSPDDWYGKLGEIVGDADIERVGYAVPRGVVRKTLR